MKHIPTHLLPALALLALGGCATSNGLTTTEPDGIYYSSKDRTTEVAAVSTANQATDYAATDDPNAVGNPDYQDGSARTRGSASDEYYDDDFDYAYYARQRRYNGLGMGYNIAYADPFWYRPTLAYADPFMYSPYGYSAWNDPFWGPSWYNGWYSSGISLSFGWGMGGWGGWGPYGGGYYGRPIGYGGWGPYGGYGYGNGYLDGYYSGLYNSGYYGGYWNGYRNGGRTANYRVGPRRDRGVEVVGGSANGSGGRPRVGEATGGRSLVDNNGGMVGSGRARGRVQDVSGQAGQLTGGGGQVVSQPEAVGAQPGRGRLTRIQEAGTEVAPNGGVRPTLQGETAGQPTRYNPNQRNRVDEAGQPANGDQMSQPQRTRRERFADNGGQPQQQSEPTRRQRVYDQQPTRTYEQPTRSYEQPARSEPSRSFGGGNSGGGGFGGGSNSGGGGGGRGRVR